MATKREILLDPTSCFNKAALDEPIFILRGKDAHCTIPAIKAWLHEARRQAKHSLHRELALNDIDTFMIYCEALEQGVVTHEPIDQAGLTRFMIDQFAPELVQKMSRLEQREKEREERDAAEVAETVEDCGAGIALQQMTVAHAVETILKRYPQYSVENLTQRLEYAEQQYRATLSRARVKAEERSAEQVAGDEHEQNRAAAIDEAARTAHTQPPAQDKDGPHEPPIPPNHHPVA